MDDAEPPPPAVPSPRAFYEPVPSPDGTSSVRRFTSTTATVGPWSPQHQHGGPPAALLGHVLASTLPREGQRIARLSLEILGPVPVAELVVTTEIVRAGRRVELLSAKASAGGRDVLRATAWRIAAEQGRNPARGPHEAPPALPQEPTPFYVDVPHFGYAHALEWRFVEGARTAATQAGSGPATVWTRSRLPLVAGAPLSGLERALLLADSANGISAELPLERWTFVPVDMTVVLHRHPTGEWVGMRAETILAGDGIGMTRARLFDREGALGESLQTLFVAPREA